MLVLPWMEIQSLMGESPWPPENHLGVIDAIVDIIGLEAISRARLIIVFNPEENTFVIIKQQATIYSDWTPYPMTLMLDLLTGTALLST